MTCGEALALAQQDCSLCYGLGLCPGRNGEQRSCNCVWRAVFRICHRRFRSIVEYSGYLSGANVNRVTHAWRSGMGATNRAIKPFPIRLRVNEEYCADFVLLAKRALRGDRHLVNIFKWRYLYGADYLLINRKLGRPLKDRMLFHDYYRIEQACGRAFAETEPYGLFPLDEYFGGTVCSVRTTSSAVASSAKREGAIGRPLRAPLKQKAAA